MGEVRRMRPLLGTYVEIGAEGTDAVTQRAVNEAFATIESIHAALSFQNPDSELSHLNRNPCHWTSLSRTALQVLKLARAIGIASGERFNCTVGGQMVRWGALPDHTHDYRVDVGESQDIELRPGGARLRRAVLVTLDGIAKGFAVDRAIATLVLHGVRSGWVNAGGDLRVYGDKRLEVMRRDQQGRLQALGYLQNGAIASSYVGDTTTADLPGRTVGAVMDDSESDNVVSIMARRAWRADALTKVAGATTAAERSALVFRLGGTLVSTGAQL